MSYASIGGEEFSSGPPISQGFQNSSSSGVTSTDGREVQIGNGGRALSSQVGGTSSSSAISKFKIKSPQAYPIEIPESLRSLLGNHSSMSVDALVKELEKLDCYGNSRIYSIAQDRDSKKWEDLLSLFQQEEIPLNCRRVLIELFSKKLVEVLDVTSSEESVRSVRFLRNFFSGESSDGDTLVSLIAKDRDPKKWEALLSLLQQEGMPENYRNIFFESFLKAVAKPDGNGEIVLTYIVTRSDSEKFRQILKLIFNKRIIPQQVRHSLARLLVENLMSFNKENKVPFFKMKSLNLGSYISYDHDECKNLIRFLILLREKEFSFLSDIFFEKFERIDFLEPFEGIKNIYAVEVLLKFTLLKKSFSSSYVELVVKSLKKYNVENFSVFFRRIFEPSGKNWLSGFLSLLQEKTLPPFLKEELLQVFISLFSNPDSLLHYIENRQEDVEQLIGFFEDPSIGFHLLRPIEQCLQTRNHGGKRPFDGPFFSSSSYSSIAFRQAFVDKVNAALGNGVKLLQERVNESSGNRLYPDIEELLIGFVEDTSDRVFFPEEKGE